MYDDDVQTAHPNLEPGDSVISVYLNLEKKFGNNLQLSFFSVTCSLLADVTFRSVGFVEFRTPQEATAAMNLDGIVFRYSRLSAAYYVSFPYIPCLCFHGLAGATCSKS